MPSTDVTDGTPLPNTASDRKSNEAVRTIPDLLTAVAAAVGTLHMLEKVAREKAERELRDFADVVGRIEAGVGSATALSISPFPHGVVFLDL